MACLAEKSIIKSKEAIKYARSLELDSLQTQIIRLEGELTRKKKNGNHLKTKSIL
ncbi:putative membrane protein [Emiliania huxleyi virus 145]|nr:putative membrane protein [Emiliania huxleyi virus 145]